MPSPFPGMDPYLENPDDWRGFHATLITFLASYLNNHLPVDFAARVEERLYLLRDERNFVADVALVPRTATERRGQTAASTAVLDRIEADPPLLLRVEPLEVRETYIEITAVRGKRQVVTVIELLSPTNKDGEGRKKYLQKQSEILLSDV